jgi:hypothetical protein
MYSPGKILYFDPFYFKNGNTAKPKYFIVLHNDHSHAVLACLPTRKDHVPSNITLTHGCINADELNFNCYHFQAGVQIATNSDFSFSEPTFVYGSQVDTYELSLLQETYQVEGVEYEIVGTMKKDEFKKLIECFVNSASVKRKFKGVLQKALDSHK